MNGSSNTWAVVLAAGQGNRLKSLTTDHRGVAIPKQFCSLRGGPTLLQETLKRARAVVAPERITAVVAAEHREWWQPMLAELPAANRIVQPHNRGTGNGILLPLLQILDRDPLATVVLLPSDHYVRDERPLSASIQRALEQTVASEHGIVLLGVEPERNDPELGYILPGAGGPNRAQPVIRFVEKPLPDVAAHLLAAGALWNSFIIVANGHSLLELYLKRFPQVVAAMIDALRSPSGSRAQNLERLYRKLPEIDFSRDVAAGAEALLSVIPVPRCGWSDLGTPRRVGEAVSQLARGARHASAAATPWFNLAQAHAHLQVAG